MDKWLEMLGRLAELTQAELDELDAGLLAEFDRLEKEPRTPAVVSDMTKVSNAYTEVTAEQTARVEAEDKAKAASDEMARAREAKATKKDDDTSDDRQTPGKKVPEPTEPADNPRHDVPDPARETKSDPDPQVPVLKDPAPDVETVETGRELQPAAASDKTTFAAMRDTQTGDPVVNRGSRPRVSAKFVSQTRAIGIDTGDEITDVDKLHELTVRRVEQLGRGTGEPVLVASIQYQYPEELTLRGDGHDMEKIDAVTSRQALVASGGICHPVAIDYTIPVVVSDAEPIRDALPSFNATRGGLRYVMPPTFASVGASGTTIWTEATDRNPGGKTKPVQTFQCGVEVEVLVDAIPTRLQFGNMMSRFSPEIISANTTMAMAAAARIRELNRLNKIATASTTVSSGQLLGASRDILATLDLVLAAMRFRSRLDDNVRMRSLWPSWVKDLFRADLARSRGGTEVAPYAVTDAEIASWFAARGVTTTFFIDGQTAVTGGNVGQQYPFQGFSTQGGNGAPVVDWPSKLVWYLFPEGMFQRLDGGRLDFGVVRDSTLNSVNDYQTFVETFENIAQRTSLEAYQVVSQVRPNGSYAGSVQTAPSPAIY